MSDLDHLPIAPPELRELVAAEELPNIGSEEETRRFNAQLDEELEENGRLLAEDDV